MSFNPRYMASGAGMKYYMSGKSCKYNHQDLRYTKSGVCVECHKNRSKLRAEAIRKDFIQCGYGLKAVTVHVHPDDVEQLEGFAKALKLDRGIY